MFAAGGSFYLVIEALLEANAKIDAVDRSKVTAYPLQHGKSRYDVLL
jgi:hypothetical protein